MTLLVLSDQFFPGKILPLRSVCIGSEVKDHHGGGIFQLRVKIRVRGDPLLPFAFLCARFLLHGVVAVQLMGGVDPAQEFFRRDRSRDVLPSGLPGVFLPLAVLKYRRSSIAMTPQMRMSVPGENTTRQRSLAQERVWCAAQQK